MVQLSKEKAILSLRIESVLVMQAMIVDGVWLIDHSFMPIDEYLTLDQRYLLQLKDHACALFLKNAPESSQFLWRYWRGIIML